MRKLNAIITVLIMILFLMHLIWGGLILTGMTNGGNSIFAFFSYMLVIFIFFHVVIGIKFTIDTLRAARRSKTFYYKENKLFLIRRISGFALLLFVLLHVVLFLGSSENGNYRLSYFGTLSLFTQILMVISLLVHLVSNITPLRIALGITDKVNIRTDIMFVLVILLFLSAIAFIIYFIRWQVI